MVVSRPRRVDTYGEWETAAVVCTLEELERAYVKCNDLWGQYTCSDVVDLLWDMLMYKEEAQTLDGRPAIIRLSEEMS